jgi:hypothetical protein
MPKYRVVFACSCVVEAENPDEALEEAESKSRYELDLEFETVEKVSE